MSRYYYPDKCKRCGVTEEEEEIRNFYCETCEADCDLCLIGEEEIREKVPECYRISEDMKRHIYQKTAFLKSNYPGGEIWLEEFRDGDYNDPQRIGVSLFVYVRLKTGESERAAKIRWFYNDWELPENKFCYMAFAFTPDAPEIARTEPVQANLFNDYR